MPKLKGTVGTEQGYKEAGNVCGQVSGWDLGKCLLKYTQVGGWGEETGGYKGVMWC